MNGKAQDLLLTAYVFYFEFTVDMFVEKLIARI
jgi:hypothetical protein